MKTTGGDSSKRRPVTAAQPKSNDSGVLSDLDMNKNSLSHHYSSENKTKMGSWSSLTYSFTDSAQSSARDYSTGCSSRSAATTSSSGHYTQSLSECRSADSVLPELNQVPYTSSDILAALQKSDFQQNCGNLSIECLERLAYLLQRPLIRIAREAKRLCHHFNKCSRHEIQSACKVILSPYMFKECNKQANQAVSMYSMVCRDFKQSKSSHCGLTLSVGKHHRWLIEAHVAGYVHELASVYLAAMMESIAQKTAILAFPKESLACSVITTSMLESGIQESVDLYSLFHAASHLLSGRDFTDAPSAPLLKSSTTSTRMRLNPNIQKTIENNIISACVSSIAELSDLLNQAMHHWYEKSTNHNLMWSSPALHSLYHYMRCTQQDCCTSNYPSIALESERHFTSKPPLTEWVRVACAFTEHRKHSVVDSDDVMQAARVLLPNFDCPIRSLRCITAVDSNANMETLQTELTMTLLLNGKSELVNQTTFMAALDATDSQDMTALMYAVTQRDEALVQMLLESGSSPDVALPLNHPSCAGWTALHFAVSSNNAAIAEMLLEAGCNVDGAASHLENHVDTPLQVSSACGYLDCVSLLLKRQAYTHHQTMLLPTYEGSARYSAFSLASSHGHRDVLSRLFNSSLKIAKSNLLTLSEMLEEVQTMDSAYQRNLEKTNLLRNKAEQVYEEDDNVYMVIENDYMTIEEVHQYSHKYEQLKCKLASYQLNTLQESMHNAAENGFLDICLEIHAAGMPWTPYIWYMALQTAHITHRKNALQSLLTEFNTINQTEGISFMISHILPLMFEIFRENKNEMISKQLASVFSQLYGSQPLPVLKEIRTHPTPLIDSRYINSRDMADVVFVVEGQTFYSHKIILASASPTFKAMLSSCADSSMPEIEISDMDYQTFENVLRYMYGGVIDIKLDTSDHRPARNLLGAANYFQLDGLKRRCEIILSKILSVDNCVAVYKAAKLYHGDELMEICEAFFLQHLNTLLRTSDTFKRVLNSTKVHNRELFNRLCMALSTRLEMRHKGVMSPACSL